jgi:hypothetical protein
MHTAALTVASLASGSEGYNMAVKQEKVLPVRPCGPFRLRSGV